MPEPSATGASAHDRWLYLILLLALILRTYHLAYPPWDYHNWRQTNTLMVARDFARHGFHILYPQVQWVSRDRPSEPSYFSGEFSIQSILAALLYKVFGESDAATRIVVVGFSLLGIYFLYLLLDRRAGRLAARLGAIVYTLLPYHLFFGRVFMPDVPALSLGLGGLELLDRWSDDRRWKHLLAAATLTALALLQKLTVVFLALPMFYLLWTALGRKLLARAEPYVFATIAGLPALAWYSHAATLAHLSGFNILPVGSFANHLGLWLEGPFVLEVLRRLANEAFSPLGLALAAIGLFWPRASRVSWVFRLWVAAAALLLFFIPDVVAAKSYYFLLLVPAGAALAALPLAALASRPRGRAPLALLIVLLGADSIRSALPLYQADRSPHDLGTLLKRLSSAQELIATACGGSPSLLYAADRRGWINAKYDLSRLERLSQAGAHYYVSAFPPSTPEERELLRELDARFIRLTSQDGAWPVYLLAATPPPLRDVPVGEIANPYPVNFGNQIELLGTSMRDLLEWPSAFAVTYYWQPLKKVDANLRIFVHVTTSQGQIVAQQDHWPLAGHLPTLEWNAGEIIREQYVVILPGNLVAGRYQLRVGWFDPLKGPRLHIVSPGASDGEDRAPVAEIEVRRAPRYRWFSVDY